MDILNKTPEAIRAEKMTAYLDKYSEFKMVCYSHEEIVSREERAILFVGFLRGDK